jgi:hypothetical protein
MMSATTPNADHWQALSWSERLVLRNESTDPDLAVPFLECPRHVALALELSGALDRIALADSLHQFHCRHVVLRSTFGADAGGTRRLSGRPTREEDGCRTTECRDSEDLPAALAREINQPFDLASGPLFRWRLFRMAEHKHALVVTAHHVVFDAWSKRVLMREVSEGYATACAGGARAEAPAAGYNGYVAEEHQRILGVAGQQAALAWTRLVNKAADPKVRGDVSRPAATNGVQHSVNLDSSTVAAMRAFSKGAGLTMAVTTLASFAMLVHALTGQRRVTTGVPIADRPRRQFEGLAGLCMNVLPIDSDISTNPTFCEFAASLHRGFSEAHAIRLPFGYLLEHLQCADATGWVPFRVVFNYINIPRVRFEVGGLSGSLLTTAPAAPAAADISVHVHDRGDTLSCLFIGKGSRFSSNRVGEIAQQYLRMVTTVFAAPSRPIGELMEATC